MKRLRYVTKEGKDCEDLDGYKVSYLILLHTLHQHKMAQSYGDYTVSNTIVMPKQFHKTPHKFIRNYYEFRQHCDHEHDCCGCIFQAHVTRIIKLNRRDWNVHVTFYRNL